MYALPLALLVVLSAAPSPPAATASPASPAPSNSGAQAATDTGGDGADTEPQAPPGSKEDRALWSAGRAANEDVVVSRANAGRLQTSVRTERLLERLAAAEQAVSRRERDKYEDLREDLLERWKENYEVLSRRWPVDPTRACSYPLLMLEAAMHAAAFTSGDHRGELAEPRGDLRTCIDRAGLAVRHMTKANRALEAALAEARTAIGKYDGAAAAAAAGAPESEK